MRLKFGLCCLCLLVVSSLSAQVTGLNGWNIFLDPGHSQKENMGIYGYAEAERNVRVALRLQEMLMTTTDIDTVYISRTNDSQSVSLSQRTAKANNLGADWFHSIHSNAGSPQSNSTLLLWGQYNNGSEKIPNGGQAMSDIIVDILTRGMRTNTQGSIGDCSFYTWSTWCQTSGGPYLHVNRVTQMPSELSESGYHTNPKQNQIFMNDDWKKLEARIFYWSILEYFEIDRPVVGICTGIVYDLETDIPVNGATITLDGQSYTTDTYQSMFYKYSTNPDQLHNGFYYIENLPNDTLQLIVEHQDFYNDTISVYIQDDFFTFKDVNLISTISPKVVSTTPEQNFDQFPAWENIIIQFNRRMDTLAVNSAISAIPELTGSFFWSENDTKVAFRADSVGFETDYTLTISSLATDKYGHFLDGDGDGTGGDDFTLLFKTGPEDMTPPQIHTVYPAMTSNNIELLPLINIVYDELLDTTSVSADFYKLERLSDRSAVPGTLRYYIVNEQSVFCFFPAEQLFPEEIYISRINSGLKDLFGNEVTSAKSYSFQTGADYYITKKIAGFDSTFWWQPSQSGSTSGTTEATVMAADTVITNLLTGSKKSMLLHYGWDEYVNSWLIREYLGGGPPRSVLFDKNSIMRLYVFGDGSGIKLRFAVDDNYPVISAANHEVSPWFTVDWLGWKSVEWDMANDGTGTWIGDGSLDGTLRFDSIQLTHSPGEPLTGKLYFDDLSVNDKVAVEVADYYKTIPKNFALFQNYPNPFNPTTTIKFALPVQTMVELTVFDITGKKITTLINSDLNPGIHSVVFDAKGLASGMYLYRIKGGNFEETKKLLLLH